MNFDFLKKKYNKKVVRKLKDMSDKFKNSEKQNQNKILYEVYIKDFVTFEAGLTVINPGTINKEFHMTKGHRHTKKREEIYILLKGKGKLLIENNKIKIITMKKDTPVIIPSNSGHRLINTGNTKMEVITFYSKDAGHDYKFKFKKRFFKR